MACSYWYCAGLRILCNCGAFPIDFRHKIIDYILGSVDLSWDSSKYIESDPTLHRTPVVFLTAS